MPKRRHSAAASRRNFLKGASLVGAAAAITAPEAAKAIPGAPQERLKAAISGPLQIAAETMPPANDPVNQTSSGGDFMVDVLNSLGIEYLAINCASSYRGLHEAVVNHGNNKPEIITCVHEDIAVHMAQGYAKIESKPMAMACHGVVGLQHAAMAIYNAWCDRVPVFVMGGNIMEADKRAPGAEWPHSGVDIGHLVREFTKWDDQPASLQHFAESAVRAYKIATTPPMGPVFLALDAELQENPIAAGKNLRIPKFERVIPPQGDSGAIAEAAKLLVEAQNPLIICDRMARTPAGMANLVALAETLQCGVIDNVGRMNFPSRHPLNQSFRRGLIAQADVILAIEMNDLWGTLTHFSDRIVRQSRSNAKPGAKLITLGVRDLYLKSNYQDFGRWQDVDLNIAGDGEASLPVVTEAVRRLIDDGRKSAFEARGKKLAKLHMAMVEQSKTDATLGWDSSPITTARMCAEVYASDQGRGLVAGRHRNPPDLAAPAVGLQKAASNGTVSAAAAASATTCRRRSVRRSPIRNTAVSLSPSAATAISCSIPARCGRRRITRFRYSMSCTTTAPITRNTCISPRWPRGTAAASSGWISARRSRIRISITPRSRAAWASTARVRSPTPRSWRPRSHAPLPSSNPASPP